MKNQEQETPDTETLEEWMSDGGCEATDGCWVEPDGSCEHGCDSWLVKLGLIKKGGDKLTRVANLSPRHF